MKKSMKYGLVSILSAGFGVIITYFLMRGSRDTEFEDIFGEDYEECDCCCECERNLCEDNINEDVKEFESEPDESFTGATIDMSDDESADFSVKEDTVSDTN